MWMQVVERLLGKTLEVVVSNASILTLTGASGPADERTADNVRHNPCVQSNAGSKVLVRFAGKSRQARHEHQSRLEEKGNLNLSEPKSFCQMAIDESTQRKASVDRFNQRCHQPPIPASCEYKWQLQLTKTTIMVSI